MIELDGLILVVYSFIAEAGTDTEGTSRLTDLDVLILAVYLISVSYVLYQAVQSLDDQITVRFNQESFNQQLQDRDLQDLLSVQFKFDNRYKFDQLKELAISVQAKSKDCPIYVDWDRCSLGDFDGRSRRVIRLTPDMQLDLSQPQVFSPIAPGNTLKEKITVEDILRPKLGGGLEIGTPLIDINKLSKGSEQQKRLFSNFMSHRISLHFSLRLALRILDVRDGIGGDRIHVLSCEFTVSKVPWTDALPFNPKK